MLNARQKGPFVHVMDHVDRNKKIATANVLRAAVGRNQNIEPRMDTNLHSVA